MNKTNNIHNKNKKLIVVPISIDVALTLITSPLTSQN